jgi:hypothetical protein
MTEEGLLRVHSRTIELLDVPGLEEIAERYKE